MSTNHTSSIVAKIWNYCNILRDDGLGYGDYPEQLTYLLFLKMADEYSKPPYQRETGIPPEYNWESLTGKTGAALEAHYVSLLRELGHQKDMLGKIFLKAQNKITDPAKLSRLINLIGSQTWVMLGADVKGDIYEGLLQKNAEDTKSGAGQYFTGRSLIKAIVEVMRPEPLRTMADTSCGTGGFFLGYYDYLTTHHRLDREQKEFLKYRTFKGWEIVPGTARLCLMNLFLHNIGDINVEPPVQVQDSLISDPGDRFDYILTNPPFGKKSSITIGNETDKASRDDISYQRQDFWATTSNKQLNFLQHIRTLLKIDGKAAVVVPDNVLFEGGVGETIRKKLLESCDVHTLLRLPTGIFYAQGVKANVLFFDNKPASKDPWTKELWIYDLRTNRHFTLKTKMMQYENLEEFVTCYNPENRFRRQESERFKRFTYEELLARDKTNLDIFWLKDESLGNLDNLPEPDELALEIIDNLEAGLSSFRNVVTGLGAAATE